MIKFGDAVIKDNTDWLIHTPDRYVNIRYNTTTPPSYVQASGVSSAKAGSTVTVTISEPQPLQELWNGYLIMYYYDKEHNYKTVNIHSRSFTVPTDVDALYNTIDIVPGYISSTEIDYEGIIRFDFAEFGRYIYLSQCYPYVKSATHYYLTYGWPNNVTASWNYSATGLSYFNANPPEQNYQGSDADKNRIHTYDSITAAGSYTIFDVGDRTTIAHDSTFSFRYLYMEDATTDITIRSYKRINSLVTGTRDILIDTKTLNPTKDTYQWLNSVSIAI